MSGRQAREKMDAGADAVQLYTGLIYRGPALVGECVRAVAR
jgi:dihydroorotate dehydrogenase